MGFRARTVRTRGVGTPLWMAPEALAGDKYYPSADVFSFGIVMWEIASQQEVWADLPSPIFAEDLLLRLRQGERPPVHASWPAAYCTLMQACWALDASARPSFAIVKARLHAILGNGSVRST